jgi:hypothetical protein
VGELLRGTTEFEPEEALYHFPPPAEWLWTNRELLIRVTRRGDVLFVVKGEVVVVTRGLEKSFRVGKMGE